MGWSTTADLDRFRTAAAGYLSSHAAENPLLLVATEAARKQAAPKQAGAALPAGTTTAGSGLLFGWWEPFDGAQPRGAFLHDPAVPLVIAGRAPEMAAALAATLAKMGRQVCGVDAQVEVADAFAAAWSQRARTASRVHRHCSVYRMSASASPGDGPGAGAGPRTGAGPRAGTAQGEYGQPGQGGLAGRLRVATEADRGLLADWVRAFGMETGQRIPAPEDVAGEFISYGGAFFWEAASRPKRLLDAAHYLAVPHHREIAQFGEPVLQPVAFAALSRPVADTVRISMFYTLPDRRHNGYAVALMVAVSRAALAGDTGYPADTGYPGRVPGAPSVREVVLVTDRNGTDRRISRLGYELVAQRAVLRFGPPTSPLPRLKATGPMPRLPTGPLPRLRR
jgi:hypothetical protein